MKVLLIRPSLTPEEMYGALAEAGSMEAAQGICSLAAVARQAGHDVLLLDAHLAQLPNQKAAEIAVAMEPDLVGISSVTISAHNAGRIAAAIRAARPKTKIILGGVHVTALPEETLRVFPDFDAGVIGEGEDTFVELLDAVENGASFETVPGLAWRRNGDVVFSEPRSFIRDLDKLPFPAWELIDGFPDCNRPPAWTPADGESGLIITSRGCTGKCTFCDRSCFGNRVRRHSATYVLDLLRYLKDRFNIRYVRILDDNFTLFPSRLRAICEGMINEKMDLRWTCFARVDTVRRDLLELMKEAGCHEISYGIESGSQRILDLIRKGVTLDQIREAVSMTHRVGMTTIGFFMVGHPTETREDVEMTIRFACELELDFFKALYVTPFPGSELYREAEKYGTVERDWRRLSTYHCPFVPFTMTRDELIRYRKEMFRRFYLRPTMVWRHVKHLRSPQELSAFLRGAVSLARFWTRRSAT